MPVQAFWPSVAEPRPSRLTRQDVGLDPEEFVFLFAYDLLSETDRKNPLGLIEAFREAFRRDDRARLVLKATNGEMRPEDICLIGMDGAELQSSETPSSETPMHLAIYAAAKAQAGAGAGAVVHTHSPEVIALSAGRDELPAIHYAITGLGGPVRVAPYVRFGSSGLADAAVTALDGRSAVILRNHGAVTYGRDLAQAYDRALLLEWLARTYRLALSYGEPAILSAAELDEVTAESRRRRYGERRGGRP